MQPESIQSNREGLTKPIGPSTLDVGGNIFMLEPGNGEGQQTPEVKPTVPSEGPFTSAADQIENQQLRSFATDFQNRIKESPLSSWSTEDLRSEYLRLSALTAKLSSTGEFVQRERISAHAAPLSNSIMEQLSQRGVNLRALFLEAVGKAETAGTPLRSVGAATLTPADFLDPTLQNIVAELNTEINRVGAGNPLSPDFIGPQLLRVRRHIDDRRVNPAEGVRLLGELNNWMTEATVGRRGDLMDRIGNAIGLPNNDPRKEQAIMDILRELTPHETLPGELIREVIKFDKPLDYIVNRIIAEPLDAETSDYRLSFYGGINLDQIKDKLRTASEGDLAMKNRYQKILLSQEAVALFHQMNLQVLTNLEGFVKGSQAITPEQLQTIQNIPAVAQVMRIFDEEFQRISSRDKYIYRDNYEEITGTKLAQEDVNQIRIGTVEERLRDLIQAGVSRQMEDWEIKWALNAGKMLYNLTLRAAEQISLGEVPDVAEHGDRQWASIPQEAAARLMNWMGWTGFRFMISDVRGGVELAKMVRANYQRDRREQGYGRILLERIGGKKIDEFEDAGMFGVSGVWSAWRQNLIILEQMPIFLEGKQWKVREYINEKTKGAKKDPEKLEKAFLELDANGRPTGNLKREFTSALGVLLKHGSITPSEKDSMSLRQAKEKVRAAIWRRVAEENPLAIAPLINGLKLRDQGQIFLTDDGSETGTTYTWNSLTEKLNILHEMRMQRIKNGQYISLNDLINEENAREEGVKLDQNERDLLAKIQTEGGNAAKEFANIRFPFTPFMNDVIYENIKYGEAGAMFYSRRMGSDLPSFYASYNEGFVKLMDNPGGITTEDALKILHQMVQSLGTPQGIEIGQDKVAPFNEAYLKWIEKGGQIDMPLVSGALKWASKWNVYSLIQGVTRKPQSLAQKYSGMQAPALDEFEMASTLDKELHDGITRKGVGGWIDLDSKLRKKFGVKFLGLLFAFIRDLIPVAVAAALFDLGKKSTSEKGTA